MSEKRLVDRCLKCGQFVGWYPVNFYCNTHCSACTCSLCEKPSYPYQDADVLVLGPQVFASEDKTVLNWRGENYVPQVGPQHG